MMSQKPNNPEGSYTDPLVDEVREIRRAICEEFGNDVDRLCDHLETVARAYDERRGGFACATKTAAAKVVGSWGDDAHRTDNPVVDEVRAIRKSLSDQRQ
jgi:hypothetical protein